jgi:hypothetical protein
MRRSIAFLSAAAAALSLAACGKSEVEPTEAATDTMPEVTDAAADAVMGASDAATDGATEAPATDAPAATATPPA